MKQNSTFKNRTLHFLSRNFTGHILLYHSCFRKIPTQLGSNVHNVQPEVMFEQLSWYKKHFDIVTLEQWFSAKNRRGLVAITFDDAYKSVFENGLKVLEELEIPATVFVIGSTLDGKIFWRDKVRFIETQGLSGAFVSFIKKHRNPDIELDQENFYSQSKNAVFFSDLSNSIVDIEIDRFLKSENLLESVEHYCVQSPKELIEHPLLSYGNHTYNHYNLSSLDYQGQLNDISKANALIKDSVKSKFINILSLPFGEDGSFNKDTVKACKELGQSGIVLSNNSIHGNKDLQQIDSLSIANRYMVPDSFIEMKSLVQSMTYKIFKKYKPY